MMNNRVFSKIKQVSAQAICPQLELDGAEAAGLLLTSEMSPAVYLQQLIDSKLYPDAVRFLAMALPKREATWWACLTARHTLGESSPVSDLAAIESAEAWVYKPSKDMCQATLPAAEATGYKSAAGWAAIAAFWSGDNLSPVAGTVVPPADGLTAKAVSGAIMLAATSGKPEEVSSTYRLFLKQGIDIACGGTGKVKP
jgi:hypothetical protein